MRQHLKERGYKAGRISQLIRATRPEGTDAGSALQAMEVDEPQVAGDDAVEGEEPEVADIFAEVASEEEEEWYDAMEEDNSAEVRRVLQEAVAEDNPAEWNQPKILQSGLPRLRGKQEPPGDWQHVPVPAWVENILGELFAEQVLEAGEEAFETASEGEDTEVVKRPARRRTKPNEKCPGRSPEEPCLFSQKLHKLGEAAMLDHGQELCRFCNDAALALAVAEPQKRKFIARACRVWDNAGRKDLAEKVLQRLPEKDQQEIQKALQRPSRAAAEVQARAAAHAEEQRNKWKMLLEHRQSVTDKGTEEEAQQYRKKKADDARRLRSKFGPWLEAQEEDDSWRSSLATRFEQWCRKHSWAMCEECHRLEKQPVREKHITGKKPAADTVKKCQHCKAGVGYPTVQHRDIPEPLRNMSDSVLWALRPLEPDVGQVACAKHGYRVHTDMIRFWWRPDTVWQQILQLEAEEERNAAVAAHQFLTASEDSSYKKFVEMHKKFLRKHRNQLEGDPEHRCLQLPRRALEEEGLECAVWPHLYPRTNMCETYIRQQDSRRQERPANRRRRRAAAAKPAPKARSPRSSSSSSSSSSTSRSSEESGSSEDTEVEAVEGEGARTEDFARAGRNSAKSAFLAKVLGPTLGYGATYELFQFVYDLWLWSSLGAKKNTVDAPMRVAMAGYSFSPMYWQTRHAGLVDMVKQLGLPTLFLTIAPYEWSFPFHAWVEDEAQKMLRSRLKLPVAESLHIAHVLTQVVTGLLTGANQKKTERSHKKGWQSHIFSAKDGTKRKTLLNYFGRLEYQDGKRKRYVIGAFLIEKLNFTSFWQDFGFVGCFF